MGRSIVFWALGVLILCMVSSSGADSITASEVKQDARCPVCGMFVAKYPHWITQMVLQHGEVKAFDGVKDMMAYYFEPKLYGGEAVSASATILVKDYYQQNWIDGRKAFYVRGSDVLGPMGHELIPFVSRSAAENFITDHKGKDLFSFSEITHDMISAMRKGHKMKGHGKKMKMD